MLSSTAAATPAAANTCHAAVPGRAAPSLIRREFSFPTPASEARLCSLGVKSSLARARCRRCVAAPAERVGAEQDRTRRFL
eukprot:scaffold130053_cov54-Phaeocystis_antarctica.AAC.5